MFKKLFILLAVLAVVAFAMIPPWTSKMADDAFKEPDNMISPMNVRKALKVKMYLYMFADARKMAEKAILYFPESSELPYFIYTAALSSEKSNAPLAAMHWYGYFVEMCPKHELFPQAQNNYTKLKGIHTTDTKDVPPKK